MRDHHAIALAAAAVGGALLASPVPAATGIVITVAALAFRRPWLLCLGAALLSSSLSARAWNAVERPPARQRVHARATLIEDPVWDHGAVRVTLGVRGRRVDAWIRGEPRPRVGGLLAGERVDVEGTIAPLPAPLRVRLAPRHVTGRLDVARVGAVHPGAPVASLTNAFRRTLTRGAVVLPPRDAALFAGFVLGDGRDQDAGTIDDFRSSGLSHLLVVSGENVAFVLTLFSPLTRRGPLWWRFVAALGVLAVFGVLTRWEPSVLRAEAMSALALTATLLGRPVSTIRLLALAVAGLVLVDPFLVHSVGFVLSVGASAGIAVLAGRIESALPGPAAVTAPLAVTVAAQVGVAPVLLAAFGSIPLVSLVANLLAVPAAGPLVMWGLTAGTLAGVAPRPVAALVHLPTHASIAWIATVAHVAAIAPVPDVRRSGAIAIAMVVVVGLVYSRWRRAPAPATGPSAAPARRAVVVPAVVVVAFVLAVVTITDRRAVGECGVGDTLVERGTRLTAIVVDRAAPSAVLASARRCGARRADVVVATRRSSAESARVVVSRLHPRLVVAPPGAQLARAVVPAAGATVDLGGRQLTFSRKGTALGVTTQRRTAG